MNLTTSNNLTADQNQSSSLLSDIIKMSRTGSLNSRKSNQNNINSTLKSSSSSGGSSSSPSAMRSSVSCSLSTNTTTNLTDSVSNADCTSSLLFSSSSAAAAQLKNLLITSPSIGNNLSIQIQSQNQQVSNNVKLMMSDDQINNSKSPVLLNKKINTNNSSPEELKKTFDSFKDSTYKVFNFF